MIVSVKVVAGTDGHSVYPDHHTCVAGIVDAYRLAGTAPPALPDCPAGCAREGCAPAH